MDSEVIKSPAFHFIPKAMRLPFWFFLVIGFALLVQSKDPGFMILILLSAVIVTLKSSYEFDINRRKYRLCIHILYIRLGRWTKLSENTSFEVLKSVSSVTLSSLSNRKLKLEDPGFMVYMLNQSLKKPIAFFKEKQDASNFMNKLSLDIP